MRSPLACFATIIMLAHLSACTAHDGPSSLISPEIGAVSSDLPATVIYADLASGNPWERSFLVESGDGAGGTVTESAEPETGHGGTRIRRQHIAQDSALQTTPSDLSIRWLAMESDGGVALLRSLNPARDIELVYEPPLSIAPALLQPGQVYQAETTVRSVDADDQTLERGVATYRLELLGERSIAPGTREVLVRSVLEIKLGGSTVRRRTDRLLSIKNSGPVEPLLEEIVETVSVFGFTVSRSQRELRAIQTD